MARANISGIHHIQLKLNKTEYQLVEKARKKVFITSNNQLARMALFEKIKGILPEDQVKDS